MHCGKSGGRLEIRVAKTRRFSKYTPAGVSDSPRRIMAEAERLFVKRTVGQEAKLRGRL